MGRSRKSSKEALAVINMREVMVAGSRVVAEEVVVEVVKLSVHVKGRAQRIC